jgi:hypothetical protein
MTWMNLKIIRRHTHTARFHLHDILEKATMDGETVRAWGRERRAIKELSCWAPVAHACNPSYLGGRDQDDHGWKPAQANSSRDPISKNKPFTREGWWRSSQCSVGPEFKPQHCKNK